MNLAEYSVKRPVTTLMVFVCLIVLGAISVTRLPLALLPTVDFPQMWIFIPSPNSIPTQVEKEITRPVEEVLSTMSGIKRLRSWSSSDNARIGIQFEWGRDINILLLEAKEKIDRIKDELPDDIGDIRLQTWSSTDIPIIEGRISSGNDLSEDYDLLEKKIIRPIERIEGVAKVEMNGVAPKQIDINLKLAKLRQHRVNGGELFRRLQNSNFTQVLGHVEEGNYRYNVRTVANFRSLKTLESLVVTQQGLQLKDIADITYMEPSLSWGRHLDREYAIAVEVFKESNANTVDTARKVKAKIAEINQDPTMKGVNFLIFDDQSEQITDGIEGLLEAGLIGGLLAVLVLYFFLRRIGTTLIVSTSIPFSILAACSVIYLKGETLNVLNMMGLMLAVGMLVDNAVVVFESIFRHQQKSEDPATAAISGSKEVITAVIASTLTSIIVFMPFVVLSTGSSLFVWLGVIATAICLTLAASLFISLTLIPMMSSKLHSKKVVKESRLLNKILEKYLIALSWTFRHWILSFVLMVIVFIVTIAVPFQLMDKNFSSGNRTRSLRIEYHFLDNFNDELVEKLVDKVEAYIFAHKKEFEVRSVYSWYSNNEAQTRIYLTSDDFSDKYIRELQNRIREGLPELAGVELTMGAQG
ncbi:MAG: efflux RND transporter permease subunit, partial [Candidatus Heimdallarchaeota archaeon]